MSADNPTAHEIKAAVRARDGMRCRECGRTNEEELRELGWSLDVHRIVPGSPYTLEGCITLCRRCHGPKPRRKSTAVWLRVPERLIKQFGESCKRTRMLLGIRPIELCRAGHVGNETVRLVEAGRLRGHCAVRRYLGAFLRMVVGRLSEWIEAGGVIMGRRLTNKDAAARRHYDRARAAQFGTLHERMKFLIDCARRCGLDKFDAATWHAIFDLETEVKYHKPATPPYGRRIIGEAP